MFFTCYCSLIVEKFSRASGLKCVCACMTTLSVHCTVTSSARIYRNSLPLCTSRTLRRVNFWLLEKQLLIHSTPNIYFKLFLIHTNQYNSTKKLSLVNVLFTGPKLQGPTCPRVIVIGRSLVSRWRIVKSKESFVNYWLKHDGMIFRIPSSLLLALMNTTVI